MTYDDALTVLVRRFGMPVGWSPAIVWALRREQGLREGTAAHGGAAVIELLRPERRPPAAPDGFAAGGLRLVVRGDGLAESHAAIFTRADLDRVVAAAAVALRGWRSPRD